MLNTGAFERRLATAGMLAVVIFVAVFAALAYWQVGRTDLADEDANPRVVSGFYNPLRGKILDRDGNVLVESLGDGRRYTSDASVAHTVGYIDSRYGSQGIELAYNNVLSGREVDGIAGALNKEFKREPARGHDIRLTLDAEAQAAAAAALGARKGAVVALDPASGEILAMVSVPTFDPGSLGTFGEQLMANPDSPLLNRATQGLYPPGSTLKVVTAAAALEAGTIAPDSIVECPGEVVVDGFPISCSNVPQGVGTYPFRDAFVYSVNAVFATVGVDLGWEALTSVADRFGFGTALDFPLETAASQLYRPGADLTRVLLATTAFGQGELLATPLQMALVAAAVAGGGQMPAPSIALGEYRDGELVRTLASPSSRQVLPAEVATTVRDLMAGVVDQGQAAGLDIAGVRVAGKTGTAEAGDGSSHAWFIGFAPLEAPRVAIAVVIENGGRGGVVAAPVAGEVIRAALAP